MQVITSAVIWVQFEQGMLCTLNSFIQVTKTNFRESNFHRTCKLFSCVYDRLFYSIQSDYQIPPMKSLIRFTNPSAIQPYSVQTNFSPCLTYRTSVSNEYPTLFFNNMQRLSDYLSFIYPLSLSFLPLCSLSLYLTIFFLF